MKKTLFFLMLLLSIKTAAQAPALEWAHSYGGSATDKLSNIIATSDGGFIGVGETSSVNGDVTSNHGGVDGWVIKLDASGNLLWQKTLGGTGTDVISAVAETGDGGFIVAGNSDSIDGDVGESFGQGDLWVLRLDALGIIVWEESYGGSNFDTASSIITTNDGGFAALGSSLSTDGNVTGNHGNFDVWMIKINEMGVLEWQKSLGGTLAEYGYSILQTSDDGYALAGNSYSNDNDVSGNHGTSDYWIVKLDTTGTIEWQRSLGGSSIEGLGGNYPIKLIETIDGGYAFNGFSNSNDGDVTENQGISDYWLVKLNASGAVEWQQSYGGTGDDAGYSIVQFPNGDYALAGYSGSVDSQVTGNHGFYDFWVVRTNSAGDLLWQKCMGGSSLEIPTAIAIASDGTLVTAGAAYSSNGDVNDSIGFGDFWVTKLAAPQEFDGGLSVNLDLQQCQGTFVPQIILTNTGTDVTLSTATFEYSFNSATPIMVMWNGALNPGQFINILIPELSALPGQNSLEVNLVTINGVADQVFYNNSNVQEFINYYFETTSVNLSLQLDDYPDETNWELTDGLGTVLFAGGPYETANVLISETFSLPVSDCYTFTIYDAAYDGILPQAYSLTTDDESLIFTGGQFEDIQSISFYVNATLGLSNIQNATEIVVYPNPVSDILRITNYSTPIRELEIIDLAGKVLLSKKLIGSEPAQINVSELAHGLYVVKIHTEIGNSIVKILKN